MIGALTGKPVITGAESIIVMAGLVGYRVFIPNNLKSKIAGKKEIFLHIYTHVREDRFDLYGFEDQESLNLFTMLLSVSGIGPRTALHILDQGVEKVKKAVAEADTSFFTIIPRLGRKNAQKIIIELKGKLGSLAEPDLTGEKAQQTDDVIAALVSMGFVRNEVVKAIRKIPDKIESVEDKVRYCLKFLAK